MRTLISSCLLGLFGLAPACVLAQAPFDDSPNSAPVALSRKTVAFQRQIEAAKAAAACTNTTTLNFAAFTGDWKNRAPVKAGAASTNTTIETAGSYVEPAGGTQTTLATGNYNARTALIWSSDYASSQNITTQITYSFNRPVNNLTLTINDIDVGANSWVDKITYNAVQSDGSNLSLSNAEDATVTRNPAFVSQSGNSLTGLQGVATNSPDGTATVVFNKPITSLTLTYQNTITNVADPRNQFVAIDNITWCTQANVATTLSGPARANAGSQVTYTATTTANGDFGASGIQPVVQLIPGLTGVTGGTYNTTTGLLTLPTIPTLAVGAVSNTAITFTMPNSTVTGKASSTIDTDDSDPKDNNGTLTAANVTTTTNQGPTAQAKSASVSNNNNVFTPIPAMTGTDPNNDPLTYTIVGSSIVGVNFGVVYYTRNGSRVAIAGNSNITITAAEAATLEFKSGSNNAASRTFQYFVSDPFDGVSSPVNYVLTVTDQPAVYSSPNFYQRSTYTNGQALATVSDVDGAITAAAITSGSLPTNMVFSTATGTFSGNVTIGLLGVRSNEIAAGTYNFTVNTSGAGGNTNNVPVSITIVGADRAATYSTANRFNRDRLTSGMTLATATDPDAPIKSATLNSGTLDPSLAIDNVSGLITVGSSIPFPGTYTYSVRTTDEADGNSTPGVTITVFDDTEAIYSVAAAPSGGYANNASLATVSDADGAVNTATALSGPATLPPGVAFNTTTGQFTVADRTKLVKGTYPVQVRTTDATGGVTTQTVSLVIKNNPLPVTLLSFVAQATGSNTQLNWKTAQELNNDYFAVERSLDGQRFEEVGRQAGQGTSAQAHSYQFTDSGIGQRAISQPVYYRLRQVDTDGTAAYSSVQTVRFGTVAPLSVWPTPTVGNAVLQLSSLPAGSYQVQVYNATGRLVYRTTTPGGQPLPLASATWPRGSYTVRVTGANSTHVTRLIKH